MKIHLGCGSNILDGYVNVDAYVEGAGITTGTLMDLALESESVEEILAEHVLEHIPFEREEEFFLHSHWLLDKGGRLIVEVPDMEWLCRQFLEGNDDFKEFYKVGADDHYFGNGRDPDQRWGIITTHFFGNQNGPGQFHHNGYTQRKLESIAKLVGFREVKVRVGFNKGAQVLVAEFLK